MSPQTQRLLDEILQLPLEDRELIADSIYESIDSDIDYDAAWSEEIKRRVEELDSGKVKTIPWEEVRQKMLDYQGD
jgi:putative addiction module component (TIGR02574 family)